MLLDVRPTDSDLRDWVERARDGDRDGWNSVVAEFSPLVWNVVRSFRLSDQDAADAHAMTWIRLLDNIARIREPERLAGWLSRTAANEAVSVIRRQSRLVAVEPSRLEDRSADVPDIDSDILAREDVARVRRHLGRLDARCQQLLRLLYQEPPLSYEEIAEIIGRPIGAIGPTRRRCLEKLRSEIVASEAD